MIHFISQKLFLLHFILSIPLNSFGRVLLAVGSSLWEDEFQEAQFIEKL
jgi:hypothetical protein